MVGEAEGEAVLIQLASLGRPLVRGLDHREPSRKDVVDRAWAGRGGQAEAVAQLGEDRRVLPRAQVEVATEDQRRLAGPLGCRRRGAQHVLGGELGTVVGRVQVGDAEARSGAGECHGPPLRPAGVDRQLTPLDDPAVPVCLFRAIGG